MEIRTFQEEDFPRLAEIHQQAFAQEQAGWDAVQLRESWQAPHMEGRLALIDDVVAGFILFRMMPGEAEIITLCTAPDYRRQGVAGQLVQGVIGAARDHQADIWLEVAAGNKAARACYTGLGFQETGCRKGYYTRPDGREDAVVLRWQPYS